MLFRDLSTECNYILFNKLKLLYSELAKIVEREKLAKKLGQLYSRYASITL